MSEEGKKENEETPAENIRPETETRREFLRKLGKWSVVIIGAVAAPNLIDPPAAAGWVNGGAAWVNARGGGGAGWVNRSGGGGWVNRAGGGGAWVNRAGGGGAWVNGGGAWVNARGGWINRY